MSKIEHLDRPPPGWFVVDVIRSEARKRDWVALMIDVPLDEYRQGRPTMKPNVFVRIPGKHRNRDAAYDALEGLMATQH